MALDFPDSPSDGQVYKGFSYNSAADVWRVVSRYGDVSASGGTETTYSGYKYHAFTTSGTFVMDVAGAVDYLIVAGGGGGGMGGNDGGGGGGGAGGVVTGTIDISSGSYSIVVGDGGAGAANVSSVGSSGVDSSAFGLTASGGGGGGSSSNKAGGTGASGGGGGADSGSGDSGGAANNLITMLTGADRTIGEFVGDQGCSGGQGGASGGQGNGGGGGGAKTPGNEGTGTGWIVSGATRWGLTNNGGWGIRLDDWGLATSLGDSYTYSGGTAVYFASGGNGGRAGTGSIPERVPGGGARGGDGVTLPGNGSANTGGGGGGSTDTDTPGSGGSGVVIVRYAL